MDAVDSHRIMALLLSFASHLQHTQYTHDDDDDDDDDDCSATCQSVAMMAPAAHTATPIAVGALRACSSSATLITNVNTGMDGWKTAAWVGDVRDSPAAKRLRSSEMMTARVTRPYSAGRARRLGRGDRMRRLASWEKGGKGDEKQEEEEEEYYVRSVRGVLPRRAHTDTIYVCMYRRAMVGNRQSTIDNR